MRIHPRAVLVVALLLFQVVLPTTGANFTNPSSNEGSEFSGDILEVPTGLTAACGAANDLEWTATPDTYASGHRALRSTTSGGPYTQIAEVTPRSTVTYSDVPPTSTYYYVVQAFFGAWESSNSSEILCCPAPTWWDAAYEHRARFTVSTGSDSVTTGYSVSVAVDHAQLVTDGKSLANGDDLRVLRLNGSDCTWSELDRVLQEGSGWGVADTTVWFSLQADIAVGSDDADYYLYYDNPVAVSPPADKTAVYPVWDDFDDATLGAGWNLDAIGTVAGGTVSETGTAVRISATTTGDIWGSSDDLYHLARNVSGDFLAESFTSTVGGTHGAWSKYGGVHLRDSTSDNSVNRNMSQVHTSAGSTNSYRLTSGGSTAEQLGQRHDYNRLTRVGDSSRAFNSGDGMTWGEIGTSVNFTSGLSDPLRIGPILSGLSSSPHWVEIGWFKLRLYVDDEPTTVTGTEETKP